MANISEIAEQLVNLTVKEVKELADILKDQYGIEPVSYTHLTLPTILRV